MSCGNSLMMSEQDGFFTKILLLVEQAACFAISEYLFVIIR